MMTILTPDPLVASVYGGFDASGVHD